MEPLTMFAATVGSIGAIHLLSATAERLGKGIYDRGDKQAKREDWYCSFQPSDLLGTDWGTTTNRDTRQSTSSYRCGSSRTKKTPTG